MAGLRQFSAAQNPQNDQMPEVRRLCTDLVGEQHAIGRRVGQLQTTLHENARKNTLENTPLKNKIGVLEGVVKSGK